jgi:NADP-dependent 3-hydroxy acid dehydrogenase YdfG
MNKKLVVITGASSGIGAATAQLFSQNGYPLLLIARRIEKLKQMDLPNTICAQVDVTDPIALKTAINNAVEKFGDVDCLINNAGIMLLGDIADQDQLEWQKMFDVNVIGMLNGIQAVLPEMKASRTGTIVNVSSIAGKKTFPNHAAYCGTKFAVHGITENIREEVASFNVRMVTIAPGAVDTELLTHTTSAGIKEDYEKWKESMHGIIKPEHIADAIYYAYRQPQYLNIREIVLATTAQIG